MKNNIKYYLILFLFFLYACETYAPLTQDEIKYQRCDDKAKNYVKTKGCNYRFNSSSEECKNLWIEERSKCMYGN